MKKKTTKQRKHNAETKPISNTDLPKNKNKNSQPNKQEQQGVN
jgi:hypothetical protein